MQSNTQLMRREQASVLRSRTGFRVL